MYSSNIQNNLNLWCFLSEILHGIRAGRIQCDFPAILSGFEVSGEKSDRGGAIVGAVSPAQIDLPRLPQSCSKFKCQLSISFPWSSIQVLHYYFYRRRLAVQSCTKTEAKFLSYVHLRTRTSTSNCHQYYCLFCCRKEQILWGYFSYGDLARLTWRPNYWVLSPEYK